MIGPAHKSPSLLSIQILRAIAALAVTYEHIAGYEFARQYGLPDALPPFKFGRAGVDLFFVISGFVMVYASERHFGRTKAPQEFSYVAWRGSYPSIGSRRASFLSICWCSIVISLTRSSLGCR